MDLDLATVRQMAAELKNRPNMVFALVWMDGSDDAGDNIHLEAFGDPTQVVGLLMRAVHVAVNWSDKNLKFSKPPAEEL